MQEQRQLAFFERIMRPTGDQVGVAIDNLTPETSVPGRYHYRLALTQPAKKRELFQGTGADQGRRESWLTNPRSLKQSGSRHEGGRGALCACATSSCSKATGNCRKVSSRIELRITIPKGRQPAQELLVEWSEVLKPLVAQPPLSRRAVMMHGECMN